MSPSVKRLFGCGAVLAIVVAFALPTSRVGAAPPGPTKTWVVAFNQPSSLPANVDRMVADAGGSIITRVPEIGGIEVTSDNANFGRAIAANPSVKAVNV